MAISTYKCYGHAYIKSRFEPYRLGLMHVIKYRHSDELSASLVAKWGLPDIDHDALIADELPPLGS